MLELLLKNLLGRRKIFSESVSLFFYKGGYYAFGSSPANLSLSLSMTTAKETLLLTALCFLLVIQLHIYGGLGITYEENGIDCSSACDYRCSKASRHKMCIRACNTCCERCNCVPPGTSGNCDVCPCYANMTTHGGRHKCP
ncbi:PREDICTED: gibberellin-regulated protein 2-like [Nelumbo nucifera]|nr:PREDICTED: gibberellin-regulated protein 2-like [Nelumbo nucifera]